MNYSILFSKYASNMTIIATVSLVSITLLGILHVTLAAPTGKVDSNTDGKKIICYYSSWSGYRPAVGAFTIDDIPVHLCTHVVYAFIGLNNRTWELLVLDPTSDITKGGYRKFTSLKKKNPNLKTMISVGGWVEGGQKYSDLVAKPERRKIFVNSVVDFLKWFNFDGLDLDWEFPGSSDRHGRAEDKDNFIELVKELRHAFDKEGWGWSLTAVVPIMRFRVEGGYDVPKLAKMVDHIHLLTYDLRGNWTGFTDVHAPLRAREFDLGDYARVNVHDGADYWIKAGAPPEKLTVGLALYGRTYTLEEPAANGLHSKLNPKRTAGNPGPYTKANGTLAYYEICELFQSGGWEQKYDDVGGSPYIVKGDQWIGYDDRNSLVRKVQFVQEKGYGGVAIWSVDLDDFRGVCGESRILLHAIYKQLTGRSPLGLDPASLPVSTEPNFIDLQTDSPHQQPSQTLITPNDLTSGTTARPLDTGIHKTQLTTESLSGRDQALTLFPFTIPEDSETTQSINVVTVITTLDPFQSTTEPLSSTQKDSFLISHDTQTQSSLHPLKPSTRTPSPAHNVSFITTNINIQPSTFPDQVEPTMRIPSPAQNVSFTTPHDLQTPSSLSIADLEEFFVSFGDRDHFRTTVPPAFPTELSRTKSIPDESKDSLPTATSTEIHSTSNTEQWTPEVTWDAGLFEKIPSIQLDTTTSSQENDKNVETTTIITIDEGTEGSLGRLVPEDRHNNKTSPGEGRFAEENVNGVTLEPSSISYTSSSVGQEKESLDFRIKETHINVSEPIVEIFARMHNPQNVRTTSEVPLAEVSAFDSIPTEESTSNTHKTFETDLNKETDVVPTVPSESSTATSTIRTGRRRRPLVKQLSSRRRQSNTKTSENTDAPVTNTEEPITTFHPTARVTNGGQRNSTRRRRLGRPSRRFSQRKTTIAVATSAPTSTNDTASTVTTLPTSQSKKKSSVQGTNRPTTVMPNGFYTESTLPSNSTQFTVVSSRKPLRRRIRIRTTTKKQLKETTPSSVEEGNTDGEHNAEDDSNTSTTAWQTGIRKPFRKITLRPTVDDNYTIPIARSIAAQEDQDHFSRNRFALPTMPSEGDFTAQSGTLDEVFIKFAPPSSDGGSSIDDIPPVCGKGEEIFSSHRRCNKYWWCIHGTATLKECAKGLTWHQATSSCDWAVKLDRDDCD